MRVMIRCRVTEQLVPTGLHSDPGSWPSRRLGTNRVVCTSCKATHAWDKDDATLEGPPLVGKRISPEATSRVA